MNEQMWAIVDQLRIAGDALERARKLNTYRESMDNARVNMTMALNLIEETRAIFARIDWAERAEQRAEVFHDGE